MMINIQLLKGLCNCCSFTSVVCLPSFRKVMFAARRCQSWTTKRKCILEPSFDQGDLVLSQGSGPLCGSKGLMRDAAEGVRQVQSGNAQLISPPASLVEQLLEDVVMFKTSLRRHEPLLGLRQKVMFCGPT
jgi:hypothetical protein